MTHAELVKKAERWLMKTKGCAFVLTELSSYTPNGETPDAIGWKGNLTILVECKVSRSDFLSDKRKSFRRNPDRGMGNVRYFMTPKGLLSAHDFSDMYTRWGLVEVNSKGTARQVRGPKGNTFYGSSLKPFFHKEKCWRSEARMMSSALRRLYIRGLLPKIYEKRGPLRRRR